jgi:hypothetical protein
MDTKADMSLLVRAISLARIDVICSTGTVSQGSGVFRFCEFCLGCVWLSEVSWL